jgi:hypothetical protein
MRLTVTIFVIFCTGFLISCGKKTEIPNLPIVCDDPAQIQNGSIVTMTLSGKILD